MKRMFITMFAYAVENMVAIKEKIDSLCNNLDKLDTNGSGEVTINLTISGACYKFAKVFGKWGILTANGSWEPFNRISMDELEVIAERVQKVVAEHE